MRAIYLLSFLFLFTNLQAQVPDKAEDISPLLIGEKLPDVALTDLKGKQVELYDIIKKGKTILVFYRGSWCPFCNRQLAALAIKEEEIIKAGYQIIAISPDSYENLQPMVEKNELKYQLFSDNDGSLTKQAGLAYNLSPERIEKLGSRTLGKSPEILPVPTVLVVNAEGEIEFEYINPNYRKRISPELLMAVLNNL